MDSEPEVAPMIGFIVEVPATAGAGAWAVIGWGDAPIVTAALAPGAATAVAAAAAPDGGKATPTGAALASSTPSGIGRDAGSDFGPPRSPLLMSTS